MDWFSQFDLGHFVLFTLVLSRVSGLVMTAPIYGDQDVPMQVRGLLAFALAVLIVPSQWDVSVEYPGTMLNYLVYVGGELLIGVALGLGITILFSGIHVAGDVIGRIGGMMLAESIDPNSGASVPLFSRMLFLVTMAVFVSIGGHRIVMAGLLDTFASIPPGGASPAASIADTFVLLLQQSFALGVRAGIPVATALLLSTMIMGLISRTIPQLNIIMVGFGLNSLLTFGTLGLSMGAAVWVFQQQLEPAVEILLEALHAPLHSGLLS